MIQEPCDLEGNDRPFLVTLNQQFTGKENTAPYLLFCLHPFCCAPDPETGFPAASYAVYCYPKVRQSYFGGKEGRSKALRWPRRKAV